MSTRWTLSGISLRGRRLLGSRWRSSHRMSPPMIAHRMRPISKISKERMLPISKEHSRPSVNCSMGQGQEFSSSVGLEQAKPMLPKGWSESSEAVGGGRPRPHARILRLNSTERRGIHVVASWAGLGLDDTHGASCAQRAMGSQRAMGTHLVAILVLVGSRCRGWSHRPRPRGGRGAPA